LNLPGGETARRERRDTDALDARDRVRVDVLVAVAPAQEAGQCGVRAGGWRRSTSRESQEGA